MTEPTDSERLDWLQRQTRGYGRGWIVRESTTGRGMRLHETSSDGAQPTVRDALDAAMGAPERTRTNAWGLSFAVMRNPDGGGGWAVIDDAGDLVGVFGNPDHADDLAEILNRGARA